MSQDSAEGIEDPSQELTDADEPIFQSAKKIPSGVYKDKETLLWKGCDGAYYREKQEGRWIAMRRTGKLLLPAGWQCYLSGGEARKRN